MKKIICFFVVVCLIASACGSNKSGCPANESLKPKTTRKGEFKRTKSQSGLFPKNVRKKL